MNSKFKILGIKILSFVLLPGLAQVTSAAESYCAQDAIGNSARYDLPGVGYWMQAAGDCLVTYTAQGGRFSTAYNMCTRMPEQITNRSDPFPIPGTDGQLYIHTGIDFHKMKDSIAAKGRVAPFAYDDDLHGDYSSVGLLANDNAGNIKIRIANATEGGQFRDYDIKNSKSDHPEVKPLEKVKKSCGNITDSKLDVQLPIISRNARMVAGRDETSAGTHIYRMDEKGNCFPLNNIPAETNKVSFTFDNKSVLYTVQDPNTHKGRLMRFDIASGLSKTLSAPNEDVLYATSRPDGTILYSRRTNKSTDENSQLIRLDPGALVDRGDPKVMEALGLAWAARCRVFIDLDSARIIGQRLNSSSCRLLSRDIGPNDIDEGHKQVTQLQLAQLCRDAAVGPEAVPVGK